MFIYFWVKASALFIVWFEVEIKCSVLVELIVAAVFGRLKLCVLLSYDCKKVSLFMLLGVLIEFLVRDVSCLSNCLPSFLLIWLFLPSKIEFSVEYKCLLM